MYHLSEEHFGRLLLRLLQSRSAQLSGTSRKRNYSTSFPRRIPLKLNSKSDSIFIFVCEAGSSWLDRNCFARSMHELGLCAASLRVKLLEIMIMMGRIWPERLAARLDSARVRHKRTPVGALREAERHSSRRQRRRQLQRGTGGGVRRQTCVPLRRNAFSASIKFNGTFSAAASASARPRKGQWERERGPQDDKK